MVMKNIACCRNFATFGARLGITKASSYRQKSSGPLSVSDEVQHALETKQAVVALESTIITHGMPYPDNLRTALEVENVIRESNVVPATIAVIDGKVNVGLDKSKLEYLAKLRNTAMKTSRRDLSYVVSQGLSGGTTVSSTMIAARLCGISTFVTGGIGGVHRGAPETFDVSADLTELGRTPVTVVCAGVKSILDIGLTLEYLETMGVPVICYGESNEFPAFFTRKSGFKAPFSLKTAKDIANVIVQNHRMSLQNGIVVAVPIPEEFVCDGEEIEQCIQTALQQARDRGVAGKEITPFVLDQVNQLTKGKSLLANIALVKNNARVGAQIALEVAREKEDMLCREKSQVYSFGDLASVKNSQTCENKAEDNRRPVVIGGCNFDLINKTEGCDVLGHATNRGKLFQAFGGVGRNVAECMARLGSNPLLVSAVGSDAIGKMVLGDLKRKQLDTRGIMVSPDIPTASYSVVVNKTGELVLGVGDMDIHESIGPSYVSEFELDIRRASIVCIDGNLSVRTIEYALQMCREANVPVWFEPTCFEKAKKPFYTDCWDAITFISPNRDELRAISAVITHRQMSHTSYTNESNSEHAKSNTVEECARLSIPILERIPYVITTLGEQGVLVGIKGSLNEVSNEFTLPHSRPKDLEEATSTVRFYHYPAASKHHLPVPVTSVSGAGDSLTGTMIHSFLVQRSIDMGVKAGLYAAYLSLQSPEPIASHLNAETMTETIIEKWAPWSAIEVNLSE